MIDDADVKTLDYHMARVSEIYLNMAKSRIDERQLSQDSQADLGEQIQSLKAELFDLKRATEAQLEDLRTSTASEIETADLRVLMAEEKEAQAIEDRDKAESNELQAKRAFVKLEEYNADLKTQVTDAKQAIIVANQTATEARRQAKEVQGLLTIEESKVSTAQAKNEALNAELQRVSQELTIVKQGNESLLGKLEDANSAKFQAIGELKAVHESYKTTLQALAQQRIETDELKQELWSYRNQPKVANEDQGE